MTIATNAFQDYSFSELACIKKALLNLDSNAVELETSTDLDL